MSGTISSGSSNHSLRSFVPLTSKIKELGVIAVCALVLEFVMIFSVGQNDGLIGILATLVVGTIVYVIDGQVMAGTAGIKLALR